MSADDVYDLLEELSYPQLEEINFDHLPLAQFGSILYWISKQLHYFAKTDSIVQAIQGMQTSLFCKTFLICRF